MTQVPGAVIFEKDEVMTDEEYLALVEQIDKEAEEEREKEELEYLAAIAGAMPEPEVSDEEFEKFILSIEEDMGTIEKEKVFTRR